jgi:hypothetical protein
MHQYLRIFNRRRRLKQCNGLSRILVARTVTLEDTATTQAATRAGIYICDWLNVCVSCSALMFLTLTDHQIP